MCTIIMNWSSKISIKNIKYKLNEQQYNETGSPARCWATNNGRPVRCCKTLWEEGIRGTTAAASWAVTRWTPGALSTREIETPYLLKGKYRDNGNSGAAWVYSFIVVVISSIYFLIFSIFISLWNSRFTCLSFLRIRVLIFSASKCPDNFYCSSSSLTLDCEEMVISNNFLKWFSPTVICLLYLVWSLPCQSSSYSTAASAAHWWSAQPGPPMTALMWLTLC